MFLGTVEANYGCLQNACLPLANVKTLTSSHAQRSSLIIALFNYYNLQECGFLNLSRTDFFPFVRLDWRSKKKIIKIYYKCVTQKFPLPVLPMRICINLHKFNTPQLIKFYYLTENSKIIRNFQHIFLYKFWTKFQKK